VKLKYSFSGKLTLNSIANCICMTEEVFCMISEGVQSSTPSLEKLFPSDYVHIPSNTTLVEHSLSNYIISILHNNLGKMKLLTELV